MGRHTLFSASYNLAEAQSLMLWLGGGPCHGGCCYHNSLIDEVRIYNRALSEIEVVELYEQCAGHVIPTLTEWSMIIFAVLLLGFMAYTVIRRRRRVGVRV